MTPFLSVSEVVEALRHRRSAGQSFSEAWPAVVDRLPNGQRELLQSETFMTAYRDAYERRPPQPRHAFTLGGVFDEHGERQRATVVG